MGQVNVRIFAPHVCAVRLVLPSHPLYKICRARAEAKAGRATNLSRAIRIVVMTPLHPPFIEGDYCVDYLLVCPVPLEHVMDRQVGWSPVQKQVLGPFERETGVLLDAFPPLA